MSLRIGTGYDVHRTSMGRPLILGSVNIPGGPGLIGHSDADVVLHALVDALLGAIGGPDIGELFPDHDPRWEGADSRHFLEAARARTTDAGYAIANTDIIIHAEQPRLGPHKDQIRAALAELLQLPPDRIAVKATTNEGLDAVGRGEAIACWATVLLTRR